jgi:hypothetical protein
MSSPTLTQISQPRTLNAPLVSAPQQITNIAAPPFGLNGNIMDQLYSYFMGGQCLGYEVFSLANSTGTGWGSSGHLNNTGGLEGNTCFLTPPATARYAQIKVICPVATNVHDVLIYRQDPVVWAYAGDNEFKNSPTVGLPTDLTAMHVAHGEVFEVKDLGNLQNFRFLPKQGANPLLVCIEYYG